MRRALPWIASMLAAAGCGPAVSGAADDDDDVPVDARPDGGGGGDGPDIGANAAVYAHTATALYRVHPITYAVTRIGDFGWPAGADEMTDIAINADGVMVGISYDRVYRVDPDTAAATLLSTGLVGDFNGLSFVPSMLARGVAGPDVLVADRNTDGKIFEVDPATGATTQIGDMGGTFTSSGDIVAVTGFGMVATVPTGTIGPDQLVRLAPMTFTATPIGTSTGYDDLWGVGFWGTRVFGFSKYGDLAVIDSVTGIGTRIAGNGEAWWGAAVTTAAPTID